MMVPTISALSKGRATELSRPNDEGFFEEAALLQILEQGANGLVYRTSVLGMPVSQLSMLIPTVARTTWASKLDKANTALHQTASG